MIAGKTKDDWAIAKAMIRVHDGQAEQTAAGYADAYAEQGDAAGRERWWRITAIIAGIRARPEIA